MVRSPKGLIYVAGPLTTGSTVSEVANVKRAIKAGGELLRNNYIPYVPHLLYFWDVIYPEEYETWLKHGLYTLERCDALLALPGYENSTGTLIEISRATDLDIPIYFSIEELNEAFRGNEAPGKTRSYSVQHGDQEDNCVDCGEGSWTGEISFRFEVRSTDSTLEPIRISGTEPPSIRWISRPPNTL